MSQARYLAYPRLSALAIVALGALSLAGCTGQETGWLFGGKPKAGGQPIAALEQDATVWCYRTLAQADCYATEQPQYASRLLGAFIRTGGELVPVAAAAASPAATTPAPAVLAMPAGEAR